jgi:hypothetical protein
MALLSSSLGTCNASATPLAFYENFLDVNALWTTAVTTAAVNFNVTIYGSLPTTSSVGAVGTPQGAFPPFPSCTSCSTGYQLVNGECIQCSTGTSTSAFSQGSVQDWVDWLETFGADVLIVVLIAVIATIILFLLVLVVQRSRKTNLWAGIVRTFDFFVTINISLQIIDRISGHILAPLPPVMWLVNQVLALLTFNRQRGFACSSSSFLVEEAAAFVILYIILLLLWVTWSLEARRLRRRAAQRAAERAAIAAGVAPPPPPRSCCSCCRGCKGCCCARCGQAVPAFLLLLLSIGYGLVIESCLDLLNCRPVSANSSVYQLLVYNLWTPGIYVPPSWFGASSDWTSILGESSVSTSSSSSSSSLNLTALATTAVQTAVAAAGGGATTINIPSLPTLGTSSTADNSTTESYWVVASRPSLVCFQGTTLVLQIVAIVTFLFFGIAFPIIMMWILRRYIRKRMYDTNPVVAQIYKRAIYLDAERQRQFIYGQGVWSCPRRIRWLRVKCCDVGKDFTLEPPPSLATRHAAATAWYKWRYEQQLEGDKKRALKQRQAEFALRQKMQEKAARDEKIAAAEKARKDKAIKEMEERMKAKKKAAQQKKSNNKKKAEEDEDDDDESDDDDDEGAGKKRGCFTCCCCCRKKAKKNDQKDDEDAGGDLESPPSSSAASATTSAIDSTAAAASASSSAASEVGGSAFKPKANSNNSEQIVALNLSVGPSEDDGSSSSSIDLMSPSDTIATASKMQEELLRHGIYVNPAIARALKDEETKQRNVLEAKKAKKRQAREAAAKAQAEAARKAETAAAAEEEEKEKKKRCCGCCCCRSAGKKAPATAAAVKKAADNEDDDDELDPTKQKAPCCLRWCRCFTCYESLRHDPRTGKAPPVKKPKKEGSGGGCCSCWAGCCGCGAKAKKNAQAATGATASASSGDNNLQLVVLPAGGAGDIESAGISGSSVGHSKNEKKNNSDSGSGRRGSVSSNGTGARRGSLEGANATNGGRRNSLTNPSSAEAIPAEVSAALAMAGFKKKDMQGFLRKPEAFTTQDTAFVITADQLVDAALLRPKPEICYSVPVLRITALLSEPATDAANAPSGSLAKMPSVHVPPTIRNISGVDYRPSKAYFRFLELLLLLIVTVASIYGQPYNGTGVFIGRVAVNITCLIVMGIAVAERRPFVTSSDWKAATRTLALLVAILSEAVNAMVVLYLVYTSNGNAVTLYVLADGISSGVNVPIYITIGSWVAICAGGCLGVLIVISFVANLFEKEDPSELLPLLIADFKRQHPHDAANVREISLSSRRRDLDAAPGAAAATGTEKTMAALKDSSEATTSASSGGGGDKDASAPAPAPAPAPAISIQSDDSAKPSEVVVVDSKLAIGGAALAAVAGGAFARLGGLKTVSKKPSIVAMVTPTETASQEANKSEQEREEEEADDEDDQEEDEEEDEDEEDDDDDDDEEDEEERQWASSPRALNIGPSAV